MGLNVCFEENAIYKRMALCTKYRNTKVQSSYKDEKTGQEKTYDSDAWFDMGCEDNHEICKRCPLECETSYAHKDGIYGCATRAGSYTYVASIADFFNEKGIPQTAFTKLISGGGFNEVKAKDVPALLESIQETKKILKKQTSQAGIPYKNGKPTDYIVSATPPARYGTYNWFSTMSGIGVGVHYDLGIALITDESDADKDRGIANILTGAVSAPPAGKVQYFKETSDPRILKAFCDNFGQDEKKWPDVVKFEERPAIGQFKYLLEAFENVCTAAVKAGIGIVGG